MKMKKVLSFLTAAAMTASCAVGMAVTSSAAEESDLMPITASMTHWFDEDTVNGTVGIEANSLFGGGYFYTSTGNNKASNKGNHDGHLNSLRVKNVQDTFVFEVGKESTITFYTQEHASRGLVLTGEALGKAYSTYDDAKAAVETGDVLAVEPVATGTFTYTTTGAQKIYVSSYAGDFYVGGIDVKIDSAEPTATPTAEPTTAPTTEPTAAPTAEPTIAPTPSTTITSSTYDKAEGNTAVAYTGIVAPNGNTVTKLTWSATVGSKTVKAEPINVAVYGDIEIKCGLIVNLESDEAKAAGADGISASLEVE